MHTLIQNVISMGFWNLILWFIFIMLVYFLVNSLFKGIETYLKNEHTIYWYDFIWIIILIFVFVYGVYKYD